MFAPKAKAEARARAKTTVLGSEKIPLVVARMEGAVGAEVEVEGQVVKVAVDVEVAKQVVKQVTKHMATQVADVAGVDVSGCCLRQRHAACEHSTDRVH